MDTPQTTDVMSPNEAQAFDVFVTAVERYVETLDAVATKSFEQWLDEHATDEELLAHLLQTYPQFGEVFTEEVEKFSTVSSVITS